MMKVQVSRKVSRKLFVLLRSARPQDVHVYSQINGRIIAWRMGATPPIRVTASRHVKVSWTLPSGQATLELSRPRTDELHVTDVEFDLTS